MRFTQVPPGGAPSLVAPTRHDLALLLAQLLAHSRPRSVLDPALLAADGASVHDGSAVSQAEAALSAAIAGGDATQRQLAEGAVRYRRLEQEVEPTRGKPCLPLPFLIW